ncbi:MAG: thiamine biosynthesis protein [Deltaproteobacteria bacterium]|nr:MAG: thiamine biosynthesis protein [Deltaproteobacteria bacterium]
MSKALGLLSGGLDSSLAALCLKRQGVEVTAIAFVTPFFGSSKAELAARQMDIPLIVEDISKIHLEMLKKPRYGYGKNMNPCIDCHAMMFRLAGGIMAERGFDFLFSGEVLGQRPMSQNANALRSVANYSGHPDRIIRPMSARLLPITPVEEQGLVDREQLLDIQGRSRKPQEALAKEWNLTDFPSSGGGCLLTEIHFSDRLRDLFNHHPDCTVDDVELLKIGRQFRLSEQSKLTLGRHQKDNEAIREAADNSYILLRAPGVSGPLGLISGQPTKEDLRVAGAIVASYGKGKDQSEVEILIETVDGEQRFTVAPMPRNESKKMAV